MSFTLQVQDLSIGYDCPLLAPLTFELEAGNTLFVIGSNGKGKSSLGKTLLGLQPALGGSIKGHDLLKGYMPQCRIDSPHLPLTVQDFLNIFGPANEWTELLIEHLDIGALRQTPLDLLSYGQWQRVNLTQALFLKPALLILDEPTGGLDLKWQEKIYQLVADYVKSFQAICLCISHDTVAINQSADYILCLDHLSFSKNPHVRENGGNKGFSLLNHEHHSR